MWRLGVMTYAWTRDHHLIRSVSKTLRWWCSYLAWIRSYLAWLAISCYKTHHCLMLKRLPSASSQRCRHSSQAKSSKLTPSKPKRKSCSLTNLCRKWLLKSSNYKAWSMIKKRIDSLNWSKFNCKQRKISESHKSMPKAKPMLRS